jgi:hypothetical protein
VGWDGTTDPLSIRGWPDWDFPALGDFLATMRKGAEVNVQNGIHAHAAYVWDLLRAFVKAIYGPGDPRSWAALSRAARCLLAAGEFPEAAGRAAAAALAGLERQDGGAAVGADGNERDLSAETAFARQTLDMAARAAGPGAKFWKPLEGLEEAIYGADPESFPDLAGTGTMASPEELGRLRKELERHERKSGAESRDAFVARSLLGKALASAGERGEAEGLLRSASEGLERLLGSGHPEAADAKIRLAGFLLDARRPGGLLLLFDHEMTSVEERAESLRLYQEALSALDSAGAEPSDEALEAMTDTADMLLEDDHVKAGRMCLAVFSAAVRRHGPEHRLALLARLGQANSLGTGGKTGEAEKRLAAVLRQSRKSLGGRHPDTIGYIIHVANLMTDTKWRIHSQALELEAISALEARAAAGLSDGLDAFEMRCQLAEELVERGEPEVAERLLPVSAAPPARASLDEALMGARARIILGMARLDAEDPDGAEECLRVALGLLDGREGVHESAVATVREWLGKAVRRKRRSGRSRAALREGVRERGAGRRR